MFFKHICILVLWTKVSLSIGGVKAYETALGVSDNSDYPPADLVRQLAPCDESFITSAIPAANKGVSHRQGELQPASQAIFIYFFPCGLISPQ